MIRAKFERCKLYLESQLLRGSLQVMLRIQENKQVSLQWKLLELQEEKSAYDTRKKLDAARHPRPGVW